MNIESKCPIMGGARRVSNGEIKTNQDWWPNQINLKILHQNSNSADPMGEDFN